MRLLNTRLFGSELDRKSNEHRDSYQYMRFLPSRLPQKSLIYCQSTVGGFLTTPETMSSLNLKYINNCGLIFTLTCLLLSLNKCELIFYLVEMATIATP